WSRTVPRIGGDPVENPSVTAVVSRQTFGRQALAILDLYDQDLQRLIESLSQSTRRVAVSPDLMRSIEQDASRLGSAAHESRRQYPLEPYRQKLTLMRQRIALSRESLSKLAGEQSATAGGLSVCLIMREALLALGPDACGVYIVSSTEKVSDLLEVLVLAREAGLDPLIGPKEDALRVVPLFESIASLRQAPTIMR